MKSGRQNIKGFNLIELIVVVAIIGILATVVYPIYTDHLRETRRSDAWIALTSAAVEQQQWHSVNFRFTDDLDNLGGADSPEGFYTISVSVSEEGDTFTLTATVKANQAQASDSGCTVLTLNHLGVQTPVDCWL